MSKPMTMLGGKPVIDTAEALEAWVLEMYDRCKAHTESEEAAFRLCAFICELARTTGDNSALDRSMMARAVKWESRIIEGR